jgi:glycosyltransferase involved in cell wall biosynthesis
MRVLHAIHDFLPRHRAGSELYAFRLAREQQRRGMHATVLCAEYDLRRRHGEVSWRVYDNLPVIELVNNWEFASFAETYRSAYLDDRLRHVLGAVQPDVVHIHNLLNLSFSLPALSRRTGASVVATLHDYTLVCPSGGQRVHLQEQHRCEEIEPDRCARCFGESAQGAQLRFGSLRRRGASGLPGRLAAALKHESPALFEFAWRVRPRARVTADEIRQRLAALADVYRHVDRFVAPSRSLAGEMIRFGVPAARIEVADYGFEPLARPPRVCAPHLRIGFVGTVAWHKGLHVLFEAARRLPQDRVEVLVFGDPGTFPHYTRELNKTAPPSIKWMGPFDESRAASVFASMDVLVVPSLWPENSPLVIHEAFQAGVPVVAARIGGIPELVADGVSGFLYSPDTASELAARLSLLIEDRSRLTQLSNSVPIVRSMSQDADSWERLYRTCATSASCS